MLNNCRSESLWIYIYQRGDCLGRQRNRLDFRLVLVGKMSYPAYIFYFVYTGCVNDRSLSDSGKLKRKSGVWTRLAWLTVLIRRQNHEATMRDYPQRTSLPTDPVKPLILRTRIATPYVGSGVRTLRGQPGARLVIAYRLPYSCSPSLVLATQKSWILGKKKIK